MPGFFVMFCLGDWMQLKFLLMIGGNQVGQCLWELGQADGSSLGCIPLVSCLWRGSKMP